MMLWMENRPGPTAVLRRAAALDPEKLEEDLGAAASLVVRYGKKMPAGSQAAEVHILFKGVQRVVTAEPRELLGDTF
jgi:hypothetical protein